MLQSRLIHIHLCYILVLIIIHYILAGSFYQNKFIRYLRLLYLNISCELRKKERIKQLARLGLMFFSHKELQERTPDNSLSREEYIKTLITEFQDSRKRSILFSFNYRFKTSNIS